MKYTYYNIYYGQCKQLKLFSVYTFKYYTYLPSYLLGLKPEICSLNVLRQVKHII